MKDASNQRLRLGILGVGHLGKIHLKLALEIPDWELVGFYDASPERANEIEQEFGIKAYADENELIDQCDALDIVTPTLSHFELAVKAIRKGKHVFIEKPVTNTVEEAKKLLMLKAEAHVIVQVGHVERFNPAFKAALPYCKTPLFIETHRLAQFNPRGTDVSVVLDLMIHDLDIVLSLNSSGIKKVSASGVAVVSDTPDIANARIEFNNGCVANLTASRISLKNMRKTRIFQRDAYISIDFLDKEVSIVRLSEIEGEPNPLAPVIELGNGKPAKQIYFDSPTVEPNNAIKEELQEFYHSIKKSSEPTVSLRDGLHSLELAHQILEKLKNSAQILSQ
jgi:predicted dehydrogenase